MICDECGKRQATVHLTRIVNNKKTETHLCEYCAGEKGELEFMIEPKFSIQQLLAGLMDHNGFPGARSLQDTAAKCELCGLSYEEFMRTGRLGCGECYEQFRQKLDPLLRRIHGGTRHTGKVPQRTGGTIRLRREIQKLRDELQRAVVREEFEKAAELRDKIKELERSLETN